MRKNPALFVLAAVPALSAAAVAQAVVRSALAPLTSAPLAAVVTAAPSAALLGSLAAPLSASLPSLTAAPAAFAAPTVLAAPVAVRAPALVALPAASLPVVAVPQARGDRQTAAAEPRTLSSSLTSRVNAGATSDMFDGATRARALDAAPAAAADGVPSARPTLAASDATAPQAPAPAPAPAPARDLSMTEFGWLNAAGIVLAVGLGFLLHNFWIGLLGTYVMAVPLLYLYVAVRRAFGARIQWPGVRFDPGVSFAGKKYSVFRDR